jgi:uncharacterized membrane protein
MKKARLEAFSDGVIAIIITIMVLELKVPHEDSFESLLKLVPVFLSYILSFIYVGIYWNNHHHLFHAVEKVSGGVLWANMFLLFCLSLFPFATAWMGENHFTALPVAFYGIILFLAAIAYFILVQALLRVHGKHSVLAKGIGSDKKGKISAVLYLLGIICAYFFNSWVACFIYLIVAMIWLVPDRRIEKVVMPNNHLSE